jgi:hypothetical protein
MFLAIHPSTTVANLPSSSFDASSAVSTASLYSNDSHIRSDCLVFIISDAPSRLRKSAFGSSAAATAVAVAVAVASKVPIW